MLLNHQGIQSAKTSKRKKTVKAGTHEFKMQAKKISKDEGKFAKQRYELDQKKKSMETEITLQNMLIHSDAFEMMKTTNKYSLLMIREVVKGFGGNVAHEDRYGDVAGMMALEEMRGGIAIPSWLSIAMCIVGGIALFTLPLIPQIRTYLSEDKEEKAKKSDEPLSVYAV